MIAKGGRAGLPAERRTETFSGDVLGEPVLAAGDIQINSVSFSPGAHTFWHSHERGQILVVTSGAGLIAERSGEHVEIITGDIAFIPAGIEHWHGATAESALTHLAVSIGTTAWLEAVGEDENAIG